MVFNATFNNISFKIHVHVYERYMLFYHNTISVFHLEYTLDNVFVKN